ncbi:hypothetical protein K1T71_004712 [Dendrolimus kikuchii]|uniref:Uncharacterized protein n=1 Tax=Dendrolimus kikuchii TaxID=765133 RepID=A0ACC1D8W6_9NEOP|nr:hypothetical protein K1T71_004712 [Dendrolimus kikuchii]
MSTKKKNLDVFLHEVTKQFITIKDDDFKKSLEVFKNVFDLVKQKMGEQCNYFNRYSSQIMYGGSVFDGIKVSKMDEFDMDIVIRLPINYDEIIIENDKPGFVKLKIIQAFDNLDKQKDWENYHKITRDWRDTDKYLLQNKFRHWIHSVVQKAVNQLEGKIDVNGVVYVLKYKESGPAFTLNVTNDAGGEYFKLDVDLVPVIRFMLPRWPTGYRKLAKSQANNWLVVPKPNKALSDNCQKNRCWRLSFQDYEREIIKGCNQLKVVIRLIKKMRDTLELKGIASYYIKTLFLWKVDQHKKDYWQNKTSVVFKDMLQEFYNAVEKKNIPYYWESENNLIENLKPSLHKQYTEKLAFVLTAVKENDVEKVVCSLLSGDELKEFRMSDFYIKQQSIPSSIARESSQSNDSVLSESLSDSWKTLNDELDGLRDYNSSTKFKELEFKIASLADRIALVEKRLEKLEQVNGITSAIPEVDLGFGVKGLSLADKSDLILFG